MIFLFECYADAVEMFQECTFCRKPILFDHFEARVRGCATEVPCAIPNCPQMIAAVN